jgi:hypothetical protein
MQGTKKSPSPALTGGGLYGPLKDLEDHALLAGGLVKDQRVSGGEDEIIRHDSTTHSRACIGRNAEGLTVDGAGVPD